MLGGAFQTKENPNYTKHRYDDNTNDNLYCFGEICRT